MDKDRSRPKKQLTGIGKNVMKGNLNLTDQGNGEVAERLKAPLSKSGILKGIVGSNPTLSAMDTASFAPMERWPSG